MQAVAESNRNYAEDELKIRRLEGNLEVLEKKVKDYERIETGLNGDFDKAVKSVAKYTAVQDALLKKSLKNTWYKISNKHDKLYSENSRSLELAQDELDRVKYRIRDTKGRLKDVKNAYEQVKKEYDDQRDYMRQVYSEYNDYEKRILDERAKLHGIIKEIDEAYVAVDEVQKIARLACDKYKSAENWSLVDIMFDGIIGDVVKYNQINSAESYVYTLNASIARMNKELRDVNNIYGVYCQEFGGGLQFADFCFDNVFTDAMVLRRIQLNIQSLNSFMSQLNLTKENLEANKRQVMLKLNK